MAGTMNDEKMRDFVKLFEWIFAKTYTNIYPHEYIVKTKLDSMYWKDFEDIVRYIRKSGFEAYYKQRKGKYYILDEYYYWTMGAPVEETIILNRAKLSDYNFLEGSWVLK